MGGKSLFCPADSATTTGLPTSVVQPMITVYTHCRTAGDRPLPTGGVPIELCPFVGAAVCTVVAAAAPGGPGANTPRGSPWI